LPVLRPPAIEGPDLDSLHARIPARGEPSANMKLAGKVYDMEAAFDALLYGRGHLRPSPFLFVIREIVERYYYCRSPGRWCPGRVRARGMVSVISFPTNIPNTPPRTLRAYSENVRAVRDTAAAPPVFRPISLGFHEIRTSDCPRFGLR